MGGEYPVNEMRWVARAGWYYEGDESENCCAEPEQVLFAVRSDDPEGMGLEPVVVVREAEYDRLIEVARALANAPVDIFGYSGERVYLMGLRQALLALPKDIKAAPFINKPTPEVADESETE